MRGAGNRKTILVQPGIRSESNVRDDPGQENGLPREESTQQGHQTVKDNQGNYNNSEEGFVRFFHRWIISFSCGLDINGKIKYFILYSKTPTRISLPGELAYGPFFGLQVRIGCRMHEGDVDMGNIVLVLGHRRQ